MLKEYEPEHKLFVVWMLPFNRVHCAISRILPDTFVQLEPLGQNCRENSRKNEGSLSPHTFSMMHVQILLCCPPTQIHSHSFPCIIVRDTSWYLDQRQNERWQWNAKTLSQFSVERETCSLHTVCHPLIHYSWGRHVTQEEGWGCCNEREISWRRRGVNTRHEK